MNLDSDIRIRVGFFSHPKRKKLQRLTGHAGIVALLELWAWAADNRPTGDLSGMSNEQIADATGWDADPEQLINALLASGLMDMQPSGLFIHDFEDEQPWVQTRLKKREAGSKGGLATKARMTAEERKAASERANAAKAQKRQLLTDTFEQHIESFEQISPATDEIDDKTAKNTAANCGNTAADRSKVKKNTDLPQLTAETPQQKKIGPQLTAVFDEKTAAPGPGPGPGPGPTQSQTLTTISNGPSARDARAKGWTAPGAPEALGEILGKRFPDQGIGQGGIQNPRAFAVDAWNRLFKINSPEDGQILSRCFSPATMEGTVLVMKRKTRADDATEALMQIMIADVLKGRIPGVTDIRIESRKAE